ncbi:Gustatory receptor for sugar taste 43a [Frankliniella fusca]|uniref:Gustatory receptor n=1 Tax=Frankliniella fusca TaxID=407009 RepID=A0AAE1I4L4_9NEOP|nr:Gustatory receptor for sugar taste 43a [Frankliniella fusca]
MRLVPAPAPAPTPANPSGPLPTGSLSDRRFAVCGSQVERGKGKQQQQEQQEDYNLASDEDCRAEEVTARAASRDMPTWTFCEKGAAAAAAGPQSPAPGPAREDEVLCSKIQAAEANGRSAIRDTGHCDRNEHHQPPASGTEQQRSVVSSLLPHMAESHELLGTAPYGQTSSGSWPGPGPGPGPPRPAGLVCSRSWLVYSLIVTSAVSLLNNLMAYRIAYYFSGYFYKDMVGMTFILKCLCCSSLLAMALWSRAAVVRALDALVQSEAMLAVSRSGRGGGPLVLAELLALATICGGTFVFFWNEFELPVVHKIWYLSSMCLPFLYICFVNIQFHCMALIVYRQLKDLNHSTSRLLETAGGVAAGTPDIHRISHDWWTSGNNVHDFPSEVARSARYLRVRQERIHNCISKLSSAYSLRLLLTVTLSLEELTTGLYYIITTVKSPWKPMIAAWAIMYLGQLFLLMTPCQWVESEGEALKDVVNRILRMSHLSQFDRDELEEFQTQLDQLEMRFCASGVASLDYTQLQKVASTVTTYLVILLQMRK